MSNKKLNVIEFKEKNISKDILTKLKGKKFIGIIIENKKTHQKNYDYCLSEGMSSEEIIYAANYLIRKIIDQDLDND